MSLLSIFWDSNGILLIDYLFKDQTIKSEYYTKLLDQLDQKFHKKDTGFQKQKIIFHQKNACLHTTVITISKLNELDCDLLNHLPYSLDLSPSDFHLFLRLRTFTILHEREVILAVHN